MRRCLLAAAALMCWTGPALAHAAGRGFVMLLPTSYVIAGGALAVLVSFVVISLLPQLRAPAARREGGFGRRASLFSAGVIALVIILGVLGPDDPAENLLPLGVWTLWWVVIVLLHPVFGNLWRVLNPFTGLHALIGARDLTYPAWASYWPAVLIFLAFAWFQLVFPAPEDPTVLAFAVTAYLIATLGAVLLLGPERWLGRADPFALFLSQLGAAAPFGRSGLRWPGAGLLVLPALPLSGMLFVLLTLGSISFDGFANTFLWLSMIGVNPLDFPGRTALIGANTLGLVASFAVLSAVFFAAVALGWRWAGRPGSLARLCGRLVYSLIPISIAYHFAHYLSDCLVNLQYLALALNDPLQTGADLLGLGTIHVTASFQNTAAGALALFTAQTAAIVIGHVVGVAVAHAALAEEGLGADRLIRLELPLAACMVFYTAFGLWLLGTPAIA